MPTFSKSSRTFLNGPSLYANTPLHQKSDDKPVDPDAPGTPGKPGYESSVKRDELDELGKRIWDCNHNPNTRWDNVNKKCVPREPKK